jgi:hypothetical protein
LQSFTEYTVTPWGKNPSLFFFAAAESVFAAGRMGVRRMQAAVASFQARIKRMIAFLPVLTSGESDMEKLPIFKSRDVSRMVRRNESRLLNSETSMCSSGIITGKLGEKEKRE